MNKFKLVSALALMMCIVSMGATNVFYAVGQNTTDHKTGSPTVTISSGVATFSVAQTATNMGVGDRITHAGGDGLCYIASKTSTTVWNVVTKLGANPTNVTDQSVTSIAHEYTSLSAAEAGATDANHLNSSDLTSANVVLNLPCYYDDAADATSVTVDGYTTDATRYIKIYTPNNTTTECNQSQRHEGVFDATKYSLAITTNNNTLTIKASYTVIEGLQISSTTFDAASQCVYITDGAGTASNVSVSHNIIVCGNTAYKHGAIYLLGTYPIYIWNNIVYDFWRCINGNVIDGTPPAYVYNNTFYSTSVLSNRFVISQNTTGQIKAVNNLIYAPDDGKSVYQALASGSDYNATNVTDADLAGANDRENQTFTFVDQAGFDFHLSASDTGAKGFGTDLSADANLPFDDDIDGDTRTVPWDIGAYKATNFVYYAVGQNTTDHKTGSPTVTISGGVATFSVAQTAVNMGVGDRVTHAGGDGLCYIASKTSTTVWNVVTQYGVAPTNVTAQSVTSIAHEYTSLAAAKAGVLDINHINGTSLVARDVIVNLPCYYDTGPETTRLTLDTYITDATRYFNIYTPNNTLTECNQSQRHSGVWDTNKYRMEVAGGGVWSAVIFVSVANARFDGLQLKVTSVGNESNNGMILNGAAGIVTDGRVSNCIIRGVASATDNYHEGIALFDYGASGTARMWNNILYDFRTTGTIGGGYSIYDADVTAYLYNNTAHNCNENFANYAGTVVAKNNIAQSSTDNDFSGSFTSSDYNISDDATAPGGNSKTTTSVTFRNEGSDDFRLGTADTEAVGAGVDLSADANLAFDDDIEGDTRDAPWDVGADEIILVYDTTYRDTTYDTTCLSLDSLNIALSDSQQVDSIYGIDTTLNWLVNFRADMAYDTVTPTLDTITPTHVETQDAPYDTTEGAITQDSAQSVTRVDVSGDTVFTLTIDSVKACSLATILTRDINETDSIEYTISACASGDTTATDSFDVEIWYSDSTTDGGTTYCRFVGYGDTTAVDTLVSLTNRRANRRLGWMAFSQRLARKLSRGFRAK